MRRDVVVTGGVVLSTLVALATISAGWRKRSGAGFASSRAIGAGKARASAPSLPEPADDLVDRYRHAAAI